MLYITTPAGPTTFLCLHLAPDGIQFRSREFIYSQRVSRVRFVESDLLNWDEILTIRSSVASSGSGSASPSTPSTGTKAQANYYSIYLLLFVPSPPSTPLFDGNKRRSPVPASFSSFNVYRRAEVYVRHCDVKVNFRVAAEEDEADEMR